MKASPKLKLIKYSLFYGTTQALKNITVEIPLNRATAIIGPSGCGKTSFLRALNRLNDFIHDSSSKGKICLDGECITAANYNRLCLNLRIAMLTSKDPLFPGTVLDNLLHRLRMTRKNVLKNDLVEYLESRLGPVGLWDDFKDDLQKNAFSLLSGKRRFLNLASLILAEPEVLLLDEPTVNLSRDHSACLEEIITVLKKNMTIVIATRNNRQAAILSDFTAFLYQGELIETGETLRLFTRPSQRRTEDYLSGHTGRKTDRP